MWLVDQLFAALDPRAALMLAAFSLATLAVAVAADMRISQRVAEFTLRNGLHVLVIPDHRAPLTNRQVPPASPTSSSI
jgi:hypothetical protein